MTFKGGSCSIWTEICGVAVATETLSGNQRYSDRTANFRIFAL